MTDARTTWLRDITADAVRDAGQLLSYGDILSDVTDAALAAVEPHLPALVRRAPEQRDAVIVGAVDDALDQYGEDCEAWAASVLATARAIVTAEAACDCDAGRVYGGDLGPFDYAEPCGCHRGQDVETACARSYRSAARGASAFVP